MSLPNNYLESHIDPLKAQIEDLEGTISDLECDVHFWKTKYETLIAKDRDEALLEDKADARKDRER